MMTTQQRTAILVALTAILAAIVGLIAALGISPSEIGFNTSDPPPTVDTSKLTPDGGPTSPKCFGIVGQTLGDDPYEGTGAAELLYKLPSLNSATLAVVPRGVDIFPNYFVADGLLIFASVTYNGLTGFMLDSANFPICDNPACDCSVPPTATPYPTVTPSTPVVCAVANVGTFDLNLRMGASTNTSVAGVFKPTQEATVLDWSTQGRNGWLYIEVTTGVNRGLKAYLAGWLPSLQYSASCEGLVP